MNKETKKIFVVEDNPAISNSIIKALENNFTEIEISLFTTAERALGNVNKKPDYIILDHFLEKLNGIDCIPIFMEFLPNTKIIVVSSQNDIETFENAYIYGAKEYFRKDGLFINNIIDYIKSDLEKSDVSWLQSLFSNSKKANKKTRKASLTYVLDDNQNVSFSIGHILQNESLNKVHTFTNSKDFFEQVKICKPDYAVLDYNIEENITGADVLKDLMATSPETEVVIFSNQTDINTAANLLKLGAKIYLSKSNENLLRLKTIIN